MILKDHCILVIDLVEQFEYIIAWKISVRCIGVFKVTLDVLFCRAYVGQNNCLKLVMCCDSILLSLKEVPWQAPTDLGQMTRYLPQKRMNTRIT